MRCRRRRERRRPLVAPGWTTTMLVPRLSSCFLTAALAPSPTATMAISAATPMKTPSMVRAERSLLRARACREAKKIIDRKAARTRSLPSGRDALAALAVRGADRVARLHRPASPTAA